MDEKPPRADHSDNLYSDASRKTSAPHVQSADESFETGGACIVIRYCRQCRWLLRAAWYAQELLTTFDNELTSVTLKPATNGTFQIDLDGQPIWDRKLQGGFPELKTLKQIIRDQVAPQRDLGHSDSTSS